MVTCFRWRRWSRPVFFAWTISLVSAASLSSLVWGPPMLLIALAFAVVALLFALAIRWLLRAGLAS